MRVAGRFRAFLELVGLLSGLCSVCAVLLFTQEEEEEEEPP